MEKQEKEINKKAKSKTKIFVILAVIIAVVAIVGIIINKTIKKDNMELEPIKSKKELEQIYNYENENKNNLILGILTFPFNGFSVLDGDNGILYKSTDSIITDDSNVGSIRPSTVETTDAVKSDGVQSIGSSSEKNTKKDYSTTNIQVENVDEADITKTDGDYIYSISKNDIVITDVRDPQNIKIASRIHENNSDVIPEELILYKNNIAIIYTGVESVHSGRYSYSSYRYTSNNSTIIKIYDITNRENPKKLKECEIMEPYYTSRCINGRLYVISEGDLKKENDEIVTYYKEDGKKTDIELQNIKKIPEIKTTSQTIVAMFDLNDIKRDIKINSYLMDINNSYVSEKNIYLIDNEYNNTAPKPYSIFGIKGVFGAFEDMYKDTKNEDITKIYKFNIMQDGSIKFDKKGVTDGKTLNQFSADEKDGNLRIAVSGSQGTKIVVFDSNMNVIGETKYLAEGEKMYSSRFIGNKAYLVTYKTVDPLFVIDLSDPTNPTELGELKIPGYSTYIHPYDDNHIIGIGMQTKEKVNRNSSGRVISTTATITGMKMALFDVSDVNNPVQISETVIGDSRTSSAVLTNHKALLFSKEKELIAIPVNNYNEDFEIQSPGDTYDTIINRYKNYDKSYVAEGYFVYKINLKDGFNLKGTITHNKKSSYSYTNSSKLLRGLYIDDNLFTVSEEQIKVNSLEDLKQISELNVK